MKNPWFRLGFSFKNGRLAPDIYVSTKDEASAAKIAQMIIHPVKNATFNGRIGSCFNAPMLAFIADNNGDVVAVR